MLGIKSNGALEGFSGLGEAPPGIAPVANEKRRLDLLGRQSGFFADFLALEGSVVRRVQVAGNRIEIADPHQHREQTRDIAEVIADLASAAEHFGHLR